MTSFPSLNDSSSRRFGYYFDGKIAKADRKRQSQGRYLVLWISLALLSLGWLPVERIVEARFELTAAREKAKLNDSVRAGISEIDDIYHIISLHRTAMSSRTRRELATVIRDKAKEYQMDPYLILAVIRTESAFDPQAVSPMGAEGLMQVMPAVGEELAAGLSLPFRGEHPLYNPILNVQLGTHFLATLIQHFKGDLVLALQAYNRGPNLVRRAVFAGDSIPTDYVESVMNNYHRLTSKEGRKELQQQYEGVDGEPRTPWYWRLISL